MKIKKKKSEKSNNDLKINDLYIFNSKLSADRMNNAYKRITDYVPSFKLGSHISLKDLEHFLIGKYKAVQANWKDINMCTKTQVKRYNKYCQTIFCVSEGLVSDDEYYSSYIIKRVNLINPSLNRDEYFFDLFLIVGSEDKQYLTSYYVGGSSEGFAEELYVMCGNK